MAIPTGPSYTPGGSQFLGLFESCTIYLLTWSLARCEVCSREMQEFAAHCERNMLAPVVVESVFAGNVNAQGPKFTNGYHQSHLPQLLKFTSGCSVQIFLPMILRILSSQARLSYVRVLINQSKDRPDYFILFHQLRTDPEKLVSLLRSFKDNAVPSKFIFVRNSEHIQLTNVHILPARTAASSTHVLRHSGTWP